MTTAFAAHLKGHIERQYSADGYTLGSRLLWPYGAPERTEP